MVPKSMYFSRQIMFEVFELIHKEIKKKMKRSGLYLSRDNGISGKRKVVCDLISILRCVKYWYLFKTEKSSERAG